MLHGCKILTGDRLAAGVIHRWTDDYGIRDSNAERALAKD